MDILEETFNNAALSSKYCFICGEKLTPINITKEHIFPKWLQQSFSLSNRSFSLLNGSTIFYRSLTIPCCKTCNGGAMSEFEKQIRNAFKGGYEGFKKLDKRIIVWWLGKIYYALLLKETSLSLDQTHPGAGSIVTAQGIKAFRLVGYIMRAIISGETFDPEPYELYLFKTARKDFDYYDLVKGNVVFAQLGDTLAVCSFDSQDKCGCIFKEKLDYLNSQKLVEPAQAFELFFSFYWFKSHCSYNYNLVKCDKINHLMTSFSQAEDWDFPAYNELFLDLLSKRYGIKVQNVSPSSQETITILANGIFNV